jgi:hypothetical protein
LRAPRRTPVQRAPNGIGHPFPLQKHVRVPESQHFESLLAQPGVAAPVVLLVARLVVLAAIEFEDDAAVETDEIDDVVPQRNLSPKLEAGKATAAEFAPHECLGFGLAVAEVFGATAMVGHGASLPILTRCLRSREQPPHPPAPLPRWGEGGTEKLSARSGVKEKGESLAPHPGPPPPPGATHNHPGANRR